MRRSTRCSVFCIAEHLRKPNAQLRSAANMQAFDCHFIALPGHDSVPGDVARTLAEEYDEGQASPQTVVVVKQAFAEDGAPPLDLGTVRWRSRALLFEEPLCERCLPESQTREA